MKRVLIVDDESSITDGLVALLETEQISAEGAYSREEAEARIDGAFYPVILADLRLRTEEDGMRLLEAIRARSPRSRVATLTAWATPDVEKRVLALGSTRVLRKPMALEEIIHVLQEMLEQIEDAVAVAGDGVDFETLYTTVSPILYAIPQRRYGLTPEEADELVQQVWLIYLQKQRWILNPRSWLAGAVVNLCKQMIHSKVRARSSESELESPEAFEAFGDSPDARLIIRQGLSRLDERAKSLCVLIGMEGWSYEEVSQQLGLPIGSVGPLYIRAKTRLRRLLENPN